MTIQVMVAINITLWEGLGFGLLEDVFYNPFNIL
jgi:hypothetical protein